VDVSPLKALMEKVQDLPENEMIDEVCRAYGAAWNKYRGKSAQKPSVSVTEADLAFARQTGRLLKFIIDILFYIELLPDNPDDLHPKGLNLGKPTNITSHEIDLYRCFVSHRSKVTPALADSSGRADRLLAEMDHW